MGVKLNERKLKSGGVSFFLVINHNGKRTYEFLGIQTQKGTNPMIKASNKEAKRFAEMRRSQRQLELATQGSDYTPNHVKEMAFFDFADNFIGKYRYKDVRVVACSVAKFKESVSNPNISVSAITPQIMLTYKEYLLHDAGLTGSTAHDYFTRFKKVLKAAKIAGLLKTMPTEDIRFKDPNKNDTLSKEVLDIDDLRKLAVTKCGNGEVKRAFIFACYTGLGLAEIKVLKWKNIQKGRLTTVRQKTGSKINNSLGASAINILGERGKSDDYIFDLSISENAINKNLRYWVGRAELDKKITFYCGRHSFACLLLTNGANLKSVADAMGHSSTKTTLKYLNHVERLKDEAIDNLPQL